MARKQGRIIINEALCKGCGLCVSVCPGGNLCLEDRPEAKGGRVAVFSHQEQCTGCRFCALICPDVAIEVFRLEPENMADSL